MQQNAPAAPDYPTSVGPANLARETLPSRWLNCISGAMTKAKPACGYVVLFHGSMYLATAYVRDGVELAHAPYIVLDGTSDDLEILAAVGSCLQRDVIEYDPHAVPDEDVFKVSNRVFHRDAVMVVLRVEATGAFRIKTLPMTSSQASSLLAEGKSGGSVAAATAFVAQLDSNPRLRGAFRGYRRPASKRGGAT